MKRPEYIPMFSKALLAGALTGLAATVVNIAYDIIFRSITEYIPAEEFNFLSIIFASMLVLTMVGLLFYVFIKNFGKTAFTISLLTVIIACVCITAFLHGNSNEPAFYCNHGLIAGFIILSGILSVTLLPYLYDHPKLFL